MVIIFPSRWHCLYNCFAGVGVWGWLQFLNCLHALLVRRSACLIVVGKKGTRYTLNSEYVLLHTNTYRRTDAHKWKQNAIPDHCSISQHPAVASLHDLLYWRLAECRWHNMCAAFASSRLPLKRRAPLPDRTLRTIVCYIPSISYKPTYAHDSGLTPGEPRRTWHLHIYQVQ